VGAAGAVAVGGHGVWEGLASHRWPTVPGVVTASRVVEEDQRDGSGGSAHVFAARVEYAYNVTCAACGHRWKVPEPPRPGSSAE
jgi:hypothetical protein